MCHNSYGSSDMKKLHQSAQKRNVAKHKEYIQKHQEKDASKSLKWSKHHKDHQSDLHNIQLQKKRNTLCLKRELKKSTKSGDHIEKLVLFRSKCFLEWKQKLFNLKLTVEKFHSVKAEFDNQNEVERHIDEYMTKVKNNIDETKFEAVNEIVWTAKFLDNYPNYSDYTKTIEMRELLAYIDQIHDYSTKAINLLTKIFKKDLEGPLSIKLNKIPHNASMVVGDDIFPYEEILKVTETSIMDRFTIFWKEYKQKCESERVRALYQKSQDYEKGRILLSDLKKQRDIYCGHFLQFLASNIKSMEDSAAEEIKIEIHLTMKYLEDITHKTINVVEQNNTTTSAYGQVMMETIFENLRKILIPAMTDVLKKNIMSIIGKHNLNFTLPRDQFTNLKDFHHGEILIAMQQISYLKELHNKLLHKNSKNKLLKKISMFDKTINNHDNNFQQKLEELAENDLSSNDIEKLKIEMYDSYRSIRIEIGQIVFEDFSSVMKINDSKGKNNFKSNIKNALNILKQKMIGILEDDFKNQTDMTGKKTLDQIEFESDFKTEIQNLKKENDFRNIHIPFLRLRKKLFVPRTNFVNEYPYENFQRFEKF